MAKDETKEDIAEVKEDQKKICSNCKKEILPGQFYIRDLISDEIIYSNCDEGQAPIKVDPLFSID